MYLDYVKKRLLVIGVLLLSFPALSVFAQYGGGSGTSNNPYLIYTTDQFNAIGAEPNDWGKHFELRANLDLSSLEDNEYRIIGRVRYLSDNTEYPKHPFTGTFNGNHYVISNLRYTELPPERFGWIREGIGLFGLVDGPYAVIKNLTLVNSHIVAKENNFVGSLIGILREGSVSRCHIVNGYIEANSAVGGLVGNTGGASMYPTIKYSSFQGKVIGDSNVGGLTGQANCKFEIYITSRGKPVISQCYTRGHVSGRTGVGGFIANNEVPIRDCYSHCDVSGTEFGVGGFAGGNHNGGGDISFCYASGKIAADESAAVGGLVGFNPGGYVMNNCFWDTQSSGETRNAGAGAGLTTSQMRDLNVYLDAGWDLLEQTANGPNDVWAMSDEHSAFGGYPILAFQLGRPATDDFESGDFSTFAWQHQQVHWRIDTDEAYSGRYSARSGTVGDNETARLTLTRTCGAGDIRFAFKISSEPKYDELVFRIDGQEIEAFSGEIAWREVNYPVTEGAHTFFWLYEKDKSKSVGRDAAWIDDVEFMGAGQPKHPKGMVFVEIPGGTFRMGDHFDVGQWDERPVHTVTLDSFYISKYETTNVQYAEYLSAAMRDELIYVFNGIVYAVSDINREKPYCETYSTYPDSASQIEYDQGQFAVRTREGHDMADHPMVLVSWHGAKAFCEYYGYRLPTEAEWEYAARGAYHDPYYKYAWGANEIDCSKANYHQGSFWNDYCNPLSLISYPCSTPVGYYGEHGAYKLCDIIGNVREWCQDFYGVDYYSISPIHNPKGPSDGIYRVLRGGHWMQHDIRCRIAFRTSSMRAGEYQHSDGFRACR